MTGKEKVKMSNEEKKKEAIRQEDSRKLPLFILVLIIAGILGGAIGGMLMIGRDTVNAYFLALTSDTLSFGTVFGGLFVFAGILFLIIIGVTFAKAQRLYADKEHLENNWDELEKTIGRVLTETSACFIVLYTLYGCTVYNLAGNMMDTFKTKSGLPGPFIYVLAAATVCMFIFVFSVFSFQKRAVNLEKMLNPEKKGSIYDFRFQKKWYENLDELEKRQVGIASYKAYRIVNMTCLVMMIVTIFLGMIVKITVLPIFIIGALWLVQILSFSLESMKNNGPSTPLLK